MYIHNAYAHMFTIVTYTHIHSVCTNFYRRKSGFTIKPKVPLMMMMAYNVIEKKTHQKTSLILFFDSLLSVNGIGLFFFPLLLLFSSSFKSCSVFLVIQYFLFLKEVQKRNLCLRSIYS